MQEAVLQGIFTGLVLSTFLGPIFFMLIDLGVNSTLKAVAYLAFGCFISDILIVLFIHLIAGKLIQQNINLDMLYLVGGLVLVIFGAVNILKKARAGGIHYPNQRGLFKLFAKAFLINTTNPNVFFFWFGAVMVAVKTYHNQAPLVLSHFVSALIIVFTTDFLKGYSASLLKKFITINRMKVLNIVSGIILIYFGFKLMFFH